jgi:nucleoside-diphosphate-sugar epimerase
MYVCADVTKLCAAGFRERYDLEGGLAQTIDWWRKRTEGERTHAG